LEGQKLTKPNKRPCFLFSLGSLPPPATGQKGKNPPLKDARDSRKGILEKKLGKLSDGGKDRHPRWKRSPPGKGPYKVVPSNEDLSQGIDYSGNQVSHRGRSLTESEKKKNRQKSGGMQRGTITIMGGKKFNEPLVGGRSCLLKRPGTELASRRKKGKTRQQQAGFQNNYFRCLSSLEGRDPT